MDGHLKRRSQMDGHLKKNQKENQVVVGLNKNYNLQNLK